MSFVYIPAVEIMHLLMRRRRHEPFISISSIIVVSLLALSLSSLTAVWARGSDANSPACVLGKWECYQGSPLSFTQFAFTLGVSEHLLLLPIMDVLAASLFLFKPRRTFLFLASLSLGSLVLQLTSGPTPYVYYVTGIGYQLHMIANALLFFLSLPLTLDEAMRLHPDWDYRKFLPGYLID